jgi:hypothetical protein
LTTLASRVISRCALHAELLQLRKTSHELRVLATKPPPTGSGLELEELALDETLLQRSTLTGKPPLEVARTLWQRPQLLAAWERRGSAARFRRLTPDRYPDALEDFRREPDHDELAAPLRDAALERLLDDMRGHASLRMLCIAVSTLAERAYRGTMPAAPASLRDNALLDPFRSQPFGFRLSSNGAEFMLWSVGANFRDDGGKDDWGDQGPRDVTLHVALR